MQQQSPMCYCPCCNEGFASFVPIVDRWREPLHLDGKVYGNENFEGGDAVDMWTCPSCKSNPRTRLYHLFIDKYLRRASGVLHVLHVAPEVQLERFIRLQKNVNYRSIDLCAGRAEDSCDIRDMSICRTGQFDLIICSHVLEHVVENDIFAIKEMYRVMKSGGVGIVSVPIIKNFSVTFEDRTITTSEERRKRYGDETHYRVYARKDFVARLTNSGFYVNDVFASDLCDEGIAFRYGISKETSFFLIGKNPV